MVDAGSLYRSTCLFSFFRYLAYPFATLGQIIVSFQYFKLILAMTFFHWSANFRIFILFCDFCWISIKTSWILLNFHKKMRLFCLFLFFLHFCNLMLVICSQKMFILKICSKNYMNKNFVVFFSSFYHLCKLLKFIKVL